MLESTFINLVTHYLKEEGEAVTYWKELSDEYSKPKRYYHNLSHLENLLEQLLEAKALISSWDTTLFTLYYHDLVYNALKKDNEERSAEQAVSRMQEMGVPVLIIESCKAQIIATKGHSISSDSDTNYFTDADLSILGQNRDRYKQYYKNVRKEYAMYPTLIYNLGRKKVLEHFLKMDRIFKTAHFYNKFEETARENLGKELESL